MGVIFESLTAYVSQHPTMAELIVFIIAMAEAVALVGALVPGSTVLIGVGAMVGLGHLPLWPVLGSAVLGAVAGDGLSYWLGYRFRDRISRAWPFAARPELFLRGVEFFRKYGALSIVAGRFVPVMRAIVPVLAGALRMRPARFYAVNILSAVIWAPAHIIPGAIFGASLDSLGLSHDQFALLLTVAMVLLVVLPLILRLAIRQATRWLS